MNSSSSPETTSGSNTSHTKISRNTLILMACMGIAAALWLLTKLSHNYIGQISTTINYINLPADKVVVKPLRKILILTVETTGFKLLTSNISRRTAKVKVDYAQYGRSNYILTNEFMTNLTNQLSGHYTVLDVFPDTINFYFDDRITKKVPVQHDFHITFEKQYDFIEPLIISPDSILVAGPKSLVDSITGWKTKKLTFDNLKSSIQKNVELLAPEKNILEISPTKVQYVIPVEKYTEQSIDIEIEVINAPVGHDVNIYPKYIKAIFQVGLNNYDKVKESTFQAIADFSKVDISSSKYVDIEIRQVPSYVKKLNYTPKSVEYIIYSDAEGRNNRRDR